MAIPHDDVVPPHVLGIKPQGNAYTAKVNLKTASGLFALLADDLWMQILELLDPCSLQRAGLTCKIFYAFSVYEDLWKTHCVRSQDSCHPWRGSWRYTYLASRSQHIPEIDCTGVYSDILHRPFFCSKVPLSRFLPALQARHGIPRHADLSRNEFTDHWASRPFILTNLVKTWPVFHTWSLDHLRQRYKSITFRAESIDWPLKTYLDYMHENHDESPLYLFDRSFRQKMALESDAYDAPDCFGDDLFDVLGGQRPDHAWLIIGPERSGSTFHKDPNSTSAWNAVIRGSKYWIMFPPTSTPPGVYVSDDQSEVTSPVSLVEWLLCFQREARETPGFMEGVCAEGEILHVPSGWWHLAINLEETIAITQNFVPVEHLTQVLDFLQNKPQQVTGFAKDVASPFALFKQRLFDSYPDLLKHSLNELERSQQPKKRKWDSLLDQGDPRTEDSENAAFCFGFGSNIDSNED